MARHPQSRTAQARHRHWRRRVLAEARGSGITNCPSCGVRLDYDRGLAPNSAEPDHILPASLGGDESLDNGRVLCRTCNIRRGNGLRDRREPAPALADVDW